MNSDIININIIGSCVARDIFALHDTDNKIKINKYLGLFNPLVLFSPPIAEKQIDFNSGTNFGNRMVNIELSKRWREYLNQHISDYIIIDLVDLRLPIIKNGDLLLSDDSISKAIYKELVLHEVMPETKTIVKYSDIPFIYIREAIDQLFTYLNRHYKGRIIFLKLFNSSLYIGKDEHLYKFKKEVIEVNQFYSRIYDYICDEYQPDYILECPRFSIASSNHKWGLAPLHYVPEYYDIFYTQIEYILMDVKGKKQKYRTIRNNLSKFHKVNENYLLETIPYERKYALPPDPPGLINIAPLGKAIQSSISKWSQGPEEAIYGLTGQLMEGQDYSFHTNFERSAWWMVDLQENFYIKQVILFNRDHFRERYKHNPPHILFSLDSSAWCSHGVPTLSETGDQYILYLPSLLYRFIKVEVRNTALHLKKVGIYI